MGRTFSYRGGTQPPVENGQRRDSRLHSHHEVLIARLFSLPVGVRLLLLDFLNPPRCRKIRHSACVCTVVLSQTCCRNRNLKKFRVPFFFPYHFIGRDDNGKKQPVPFSTPSYCKACPELFHRREPFPCPQRGRLEVSIECHQVSRKQRLKHYLFRE